MLLGEVFLLLASILAITLYVLYTRFTTRISPSIPYAGEESILSRIRVLGDYGSNQRDFLMKQRRKLGDVFCVDLLIFKIVYFFGAESNRAILNTPERRISLTEIAQKFLVVTSDGKLVQHCILLSAIYPFMYRSS